MEIIYQKISKEHIKGLVELHKKNATEENFLPLLGDKAIGKFYEWWIDRKDTISFVAILNEKVIGHILGPTKIDYRNELNKFLFPYLIEGFFLSFYKNPIKIFKLTIKRFFSIVLSLKSIFFKNKMKLGKSESINSGILLSITVDPEFQGKGVALKLNNLFLDEAKLKGIKRITLSVRKSNLRAIKFYEKTGWKVLKISKNAVYFYMNL